jgi:uncharacterized membrane protein
VIASIARVATVVLAVAYPIVVYVGLLRSSARTVAVVLIVMASVLWVSRARGLDRAALRGAIVPLLPTLVGAVIAMATDERWALLAVPVVINAGLLATFAASLGTGRVPTIERFARLQEPSLGPAQQAHCRGVTKVWVGFFAANALVSAGLAVAAPFEWWAAWCGGVAYACIGVLVAGEWIVRRHRFGREAATEGAR